MARKPLPTSGKIADVNIANVGGLLKAALLKVTPDAKIDPSSMDKGKFLLNPTSYNETKASNWTPTQVPGQSDPILQWSSGGPRIITFETLVTRDTSHFMKDNSKPDGMAAMKDMAMNFIGSIASNFAGVSLPPLSDLLGSDAEVGLGEDLSIADKLNYYRSLLYPDYEAGKLHASPPLVILAAGKTFSTKLGGAVDLTSDSSGGSSTAISADSDLWVVTDLNIRVTKQLPNLAPMEAQVEFKLMQYVIKSFGADHFTGEYGTQAQASAPGLPFVGKLGF